MNAQYLKTMAFVLALLFLSSCAVWVRDEDGFHHHHRGYRHWHSSLQQSDQSIAQMTAQNSRDSGSHEKVNR
jgi:hypothetical protein